MLIIDRLKKRLNATADLRDEAGGWPAIGRAVGGAAGRPDAARQAQYRNALEAWRANPYAKRIIDLITDYTVGDGITPVGPKSLWISPLGPNPW